MNAEFSHLHECNQPIEFNPQNFTQIPNKLLIDVIKGVLRPLDLLTYSYLLAAANGCEFSIQPIPSLAFGLGVKKTAAQTSLERLVKAKVIKREQTIRFSKTYVLIAVKPVRPGAGNTVGQ